MTLRIISFSIKILYKYELSDINKFFDKLTYVKCFIISEERYFTHLNFRGFVELSKFGKQVQGGDKSEIRVSRLVKRC